ncbi:MAG: hotdog fold thioesterase [Neisseriaceae bacterium]|nr:hotdog fold thioesterase [Neisseriaceae bacterium]MBP6861312.1 hotdog fold thioesterase [Neisseriaceae bacterium]
MWQRDADLAALNARSEGTMVAHLGIVFTRMGDHFLEATMPVDERTRQPFGLLHGGASVVLSETLGSMAGYLMTQGDDRVVGLEINANHIASARSGLVRGECRAIHCGRSSQVWETKIYNEANKLCCVSRLTVAVLSA